MITIVLNGSDKRVDNNISVSQLLEELGLTEKRLAVEINQQIIPRSNYTDYILNEKDNVEIVQAIGGGQYNLPD
ncbi:MAG: sulfur carrier protein ThiS [Gammaproteobacteria bacterium]|jgi:sulfur carrier protein|nr:sulfur carrier protein ThiS [Gammaproteobacteria bacterium]